MPKSDIVEENRLNLRELQLRGLTILIILLLGYGALNFSRPVVVESPREIASIPDNVSQIDTITLVSQKSSVESVRDKRVGVLSESHARKILKKRLLEPRLPRDEREFEDEFRRLMAERLDPAELGGPEERALVTALCNQGVVYACYELSEKIRKGEFEEAFRRMDTARKTPDSSALRASLDELNIYSGQRKNLSLFACVEGVPSACYEAFSVVPNSIDDSNDQLESLVRSYCIAGSEHYCKQLADRLSTVLTDIIASCHDISEIECLDRNFEISSGPKQELLSYYRRHCLDGDYLSCSIVKVQWLVQPTDPFYNEAKDVVTKACAADGFNKKSDACRVRYGDSCAERGCRTPLD